MNFSSLKHGMMIDTRGLSLWNKVKPPKLNRAIF